MYSLRKWKSPSTRMGAWVRKQRKSNSDRVGLHNPKETTHCPSTIFGGNGSLPSTTFVGSVPSPNVDVGEGVVDPSPSLRTISSNSCDPPSVKSSIPDPLDDSSPRLAHLNELIHSHSPTSRPSILKDEERHSSNPIPMSRQISPLDLLIQLIALQPRIRLGVGREDPVSDRQ